MAPVPDDQAIQSTAPDTAVHGNEEVVISGMSGTYPESHFVRDLSNILYNKINPVTKEHPRWKYEHPELPEYLGKAPDLNTFDAQFFKVHYRLSQNMDVMSRKLLEQTYQAIYDAGISPEHLSGKKVGVYIGSCFSETEKACFYVATIRNGFGIAGSSKAMFANRISYWLNLKGPSMSIDAACSSTMVALEKAFMSITNGECEAAIIGGSNLCLHPQSSVHYGRLMKLCMDGKTKTFDKNADGCARSDAINVLFLQKAKDAKRVYAHVCHVKSYFSPLVDAKLGQKYGPYRDEARLTDFMNNFYKEAKVSPAEVEYVEGFGSAVPEADKSELEAISNVFCKDRTDPVYVGSVMSNIGYTEAASGISAITKVLLAYHTGELAANLHCDNPRDDVAALREGRMRIVTEHQKFNRSYVAVNNFSVTGTNLHVLLHGHYKPKDLSKYKTSIPHLIAVSGRQESGVKKIFEDLKTRPIDPEEVGLIHNIHEQSITGHLGRGFTILATNGENKTVSLVEKVDYCDDAKKPLWFVYSGMGSQWAGMGTQLMRIPIFAAAIERCRIALEPKGIDILQIITSPEKTTFDNILHSFVGIAAIQIGLTDILREIGMIPDKIIGHSVGELGCAYADGCFTTEEMILAAYSRGLVSLETPFIHGSMAAVGLGYQQIVTMCPPEIEVACHNSSESSTISGPSDIMSAFVATLTAQGIFAKEVPCSNIEYHSRYIKDAGPKLLNYLREVIKSPKVRSEKWLSTSIPQDKWNQPIAKYSSAEYHTNNLLNPVLFEETATLVPSNAVLIEIAPHGLLQAILKRSLPASCTNIPLTRRGHADNAAFLLEAIGKLYMQGYNPHIKALYPKIQYPVSTGTPLLSHFVEWAHAEKWFLPLYVSARRKTAAACQFIISVHDDEHNYLKGNIHGHEILYPFGGVLVCVWDTLAMSIGESRGKLSVQFHDVHLHYQPRLYDDKLLKLSVQLNKGNGYFEVMDECTKVASGFAFTEVANAHNISDKNEIFSRVSIGTNISSNDVYKIFHDKGFYYRNMTFHIKNCLETSELTHFKVDAIKLRGDFRSIKSINENMTHARVSWTGNWVTFLDSLVQFNVLQRNHDGLSEPRFIRRLHINTNIQSKAELKRDSSLEAIVSKDSTFVSCGGVLIKDVKFKDIANLQREITLKNFKFIPFFQSLSIDVNEALNIFLQIVEENINKSNINVIEVLNKNDNSLKTEINSSIKSLPEIQFNVIQIYVDEIARDAVKLLKTADLVVANNFSTSDKMCEILYQNVTQDIFILTMIKSGSSSLPQTLSRPVASASTDRGRLELSRWRPKPESNSSVAISVATQRDLALLHSTRESLRQDQRLIVLSPYPPPYGLKESIQKLRKETDCNMIYVAMIAENENLEQLPNFDLVFNILDHGTWGCEYFIPSPESRPGTESNLILRSADFRQLDSLYWKEGHEPEGITVSVHYAGLNTRDVKRATGVIPYTDDNVTFEGYGMDFSGVTKSGERVMGIIFNGSAASRVAANPSFLWPVPSHWSLQDAATVPLPYALAFYCLGIKNRLSSGLKFLVHGGAGGFGQAIISIALAHNCEVFVTVSDSKKRLFLRKLFPSLADDHIGYSRDTSFVDMVLHLTKGSGCDFVICGLEGKLKDVSLKCASAVGITLDPQHVADTDNFKFGMYHLTKERSYVPIDFSLIFQPKNILQMRAIQLMMSEGIVKGYVRPLSRVTYDALEAERAFNLLANSRHRGRVLLNLRGQKPPALPTLAVTPSSSQLLVTFGADETLVSRMVSMLIERGATSLVIHRAVEISKYMQMKINTWNSKGLKVKLSTVELTNKDAAQKLINECSNLGDLEGLYILSTGSVDENIKTQLTGTITEFDQLTRKLFPSLKYFVIAGENSDFGKEICIIRANNKLPATMLHLPKINKFEANPENLQEDELGLSCTAAVEAVERAARATQPVFVIQKQILEPSKLLERLAVITGVRFTQNKYANKTLKELGIDYEKSKIVSSFLEEYTKIPMTTDDVLQLTIETILNLDKAARALHEAKITGLNVLYSMVDSDDLVASHEFVFMPTLTHSGIIRDDEFNSNETYLVMLPGLEGHYSKFKSVCERLKMRALVLQPGVDNPHETITEMAERLANTLLKKLKYKQNFYLLGYSFGTLVALEIAQILENHGLEGVVYCVDGSPDTFPASIESWLTEAGVTDEFSLQDTLVQHMYSLMGGNVSQELTLKLKEAKSSQEKVEACIEALRGRVPYPVQYVRAIIESAFRRIELARHYDSSKLRDNVLRSQLVVMRSRDQLTSAPDLGLSLYSQRPPFTYTLNADHARVLHDPLCANLINRHLDQSIQEAFLKRNLCESYLLNASTFMANATELDEE